MYICGRLDKGGKPKCRTIFEALNYTKISGGETFAFRSLFLDDIPQPRRPDYSLVFLHGNYTSSYIFEKLIPILAKEYHIVAPDMRGFGRSSYSKPVDSLDMLANDMKDFLKEIKVHECCIIGWDLGAAVALKLAAMKGPTFIVKQLILVNPIGIQGQTYCIDPFDGESLINEWDKQTSENDQRKKSLKHAFETKDSEFFHEFFHQEMFNEYTVDKNILDSYLEQFMLQQNFEDVIKIQSKIDLEEEGVFKELADKDLPTYIYAGKNDKRTRWQDAQDLKSRIPNAQLQIYEDCGHAIMLEKQDDFIEKIKQLCDNNMDEELMY